jgi:16S rRNA (guanine527-N7)-methyltransferase
MGDALADGLAALGQPLDAERRARLGAYRDELARWGRVHNLTAVREPVRMVPVHLLDSLALAPLLRGQRLFDVGSGGGLPGLPLAIALPEVAVTLIEPRAKRALFLEHVTRTLGLGNVIVERVRVENVRAGDGCDTAITRAFGTLAQFAAAAGRVLAPGGCLLAAKGREPTAEVQALSPGWHAETRTLAVPGLDAERHAVRLEPRVAAGQPAAED